MQRVEVMLEKIPDSFHFFYSPDKIKYAFI